VPHLLAYGFIQGTGSYFIATSFEGFALCEEIKNATMLKQLQSSLSAVHRCGILHNDLAVRNVCVSTNGHVRILDFGNAIIYRDTAVLSQEAESTLKLVRCDRSLRTSKACLHCSTGRASQVYRKSFRSQCTREAPLCFRSRLP
jgi:tRNA A-37 threonylcarbamoyl transferase component Bud32